MELMLHTTRATIEVELFDEIVSDWWASLAQTEELTNIVRMPFRVLQQYSWYI